MSEQWYCQQCGPEYAVKAYNDCAVCCECDCLCIRRPAWLLAMQERIAELEKEKEVMRVALDKLARLGNGERFGNSIGNEIAQDALRAAGYLGAK